MSGVGTSDPGASLLGESTERIFGSPGRRPIVSAVGQRTCFEIHVQTGLEPVMLRISMPDMALKSPVLHNNRKVAFALTKYRIALANSRRLIDRVPPKACSGSEFAKHSLLSMSRRVSQDCFRHQPSLASRASARQASTLSRSERAKAAAPKPDLSRRRSRAEADGRRRALS